MFRDDRKGLFSKPKLTLWPVALPKLCSESSGKRKHMSYSQTERFSCENVSFRVRNQPLFETLVWNLKLKTNSVGTSFEPRKQTFFRLVCLFVFAKTFVSFWCGNKLFDKTFVYDCFGLKHVTLHSAMLKGLFFVSPENYCFEQRFLSETL